MQLETRLATLRHLWYCECAAQPRVDDTAANMCRALEKAARVVEAAGARGSALHDALGDAARAMQGSVADRRARPHTAFESVRRVLAVDLPPPPQLADGGEAAEKRERAALQAALVVVLRRLVAIVVLAEGEWRDAAAREVRLRAGREDRREWLRLVVRSWRECVDGRRAGAARWAARWQEGHVGALAQRDVDAVEWRVGQYPTEQLARWASDEGAAGGVVVLEWSDWVGSDAERMGGGLAMAQGVGDCAASGDGAAR